MEIFEDSRIASRADLAAWLRQMASQLESDGKVLFGAAGSVTVGDEVHCELEIESSGSETSIEIEFTWKATAATETAELSETGEDEEPGEEANAETAETAEEPAEDVPSQHPVAVGVTPASTFSTSTFSNTPS